MKVWNDIESFHATKPVVTIGVFDGVHLGHHFLLDELKKKALESGGESVALTLWPHPRIVLNKDPDNLRFLTTLEEKVLLLEKTGLDHLIIIPFTLGFSRLNSCDFVKKYLVDGMNIVHLMVGYNHKFGKNREGDFDSLKECAGNYGFDVQKLQPHQINGEKLSSTIIRDLLSEGDLEKANELLGYNYFLQGIVNDGDKLGRKIGFPTANIVPNDPHKLIPRDGVYAVELEIGGEMYRGMLNIGYRPTVGKQIPEKRIEVNLFDFEGDLYNRKLTVYFRNRMREEKKFEDLEQLRKQLVIDKSRAIELLNNNKNK